MAVFTFAVSVGVLPAVAEGAFAEQATSPMERTPKHVIRINTTASF